MVATIAGGIAAAATGTLLNKAFGGSKRVAQPQPQKFQIGSLTSPGLDLTRTGIDVAATRGAGVAEPLGRVQSLSQGFANNLTGLLGRVRPGFSELRASRLAGLENARFRAIGNLRENLARRRIQGSSFANDALIRAEMEFAQQEDRIRAESTLAELDATNRLITQRHKALESATMTALEQANAEATLGANFTAGVGTNMANIFGSSAQLAAQNAALSAQNAAGLGAFFQPAVTAVGDKVGGFVGGLFGPSPMPAGGFQPGFNMTTDAAGRLLGGI